jgi:hypothetical protein
MEKSYNLEEIKEQAEKENPTHSFQWKDSGGSFYGGREKLSTGKCLYCTSTIYIDIYAKEQITSYNLTPCLSIGRSVDPEGLAVTTWSFCRKCDKKINPNNKNEVLKGFHSKCQNDYQGTIILDMHDNLIQLRMKEIE